MTEEGQVRGDDVLRAFIAVEISDEVRAGLAGLQDGLKKCDAKVGWVAPENIHLTLVFLGDIFRAQIEPLGAALGAVSAATDSFEFHVGGTGFFGSPRSPRVLWVGITDSSLALARFQADIAAAVRGLGFRIEDRPFVPHLTLGRVRARAGVDELTSTLALARNTAYGLVSVRRLLLMQSHLEHRGVRYSMVREMLLKGAC